MLDGREDTEICTLTETTLRFKTWAIHLHGSVFERLRGSKFNNQNSIQTETWSAS